MGKVILSVLICNIFSFASADTVGSTSSITASPTAAFSGFVPAVPLSQAYAGPRTDQWGNMIPANLPQAAQAYSGFSVTPQASSTPPPVQPQTSTNSPFSGFLQMAPPLMSLLASAPFLNSDGSVDRNKMTYENSVSAGTGVGNAKFLPYRQWGRFMGPGNYKYPGKADYNIQTTEKDIPGHDCDKPEGNALTCAVCNAIFEAGDQGFNGMKAVVSVTLTRALTNGFPNRICGVVYDKGQFSWTFDGKDHHLPRNANGVLGEAIAAAKEALSENPNGYTNFYANYIQTPSWARSGQCSRTLTPYNPARRGDYHIFCKGDYDIAKRDARAWAESEGILLKEDPATIRGLTSNPTEAGAQATR